MDIASATKLGFSMMPHIIQPVSRILCLFGQFIYPERVFSVFKERIVKEGNSKESRGL